MHSVSKSAEATPYSRSALSWLILLCLAFQWFSRYSGAPVPGFAVDDWRLLQLGQSCDSFADALRLVLRWPDRPFATPVMVYLFHLCGQKLWLYALFSHLVTALFLLFMLLATYELTGNRFVMTCTGVLFSLLPNLTESFNWYTMTVYGLGFAAYPAAAWLWILYLKKGRAVHLLGAALLLLLAVGTYEVGIILPAVLFLLAGPTRSRTAWLGAGALALGVGLYLAWRFTHAFGLAHDLLFPHRALALGLVPWRWNFIEAARWWVGGHANEVLLRGCLGFTGLPSGPQHLFAVLFLLATAVICRVLWQLRRRPDPDAQAPAFSTARVALFAAAWFAGTQITNLVAWSGPRLCYVPAWGAALLVALLLARLRPATWMPLLVVACLVGLAANHGTARQWTDSARFQSRLYHYLEAQRAQWEPAEILLLDTRSLRSRLHEGLMDNTPQRIESFGFYGNASLLRGFSVKAMVDLIAGERKTPSVILDVENNARVDGPDLVWTGWYDDSRSTRTPMDKVYVVDVQRFTAEPAVP